MIVPNYKIGGEVARGDSSIICRGRRNTDGKSVLLKISNGDFATLDFQENLRCEYAIFSELKIPGVARVFEFLERENTCCIVLEDNGGNTLRKLFDSFQLNLDAAFTLAIRLADALAEIHRREIVHAGIAPDNILFNVETGEACFIDFSSATRAADEAISNSLPVFSDYALRYISPEQTRRMDRIIDYRTDIYSLGVTLYELLTGNPPFASNDPLELIHLHIAKKPLSPSEVNPMIPAPVSDIVMRMIAKTADQRYQSALGLKADLEICAREWGEHRRVTWFEIGRQDFSGQFNIPQTLYGRKKEIDQLVSAFEKARGGEPSLLLVSGYSGIGKTSLIKELQKKMPDGSGYFITGKFDQVARGVPFSALIQAFRALVLQLLTESDEQVAMWRSKLSQVLGPNGGVLAEVVPEIELIIGKQVPPTELGTAETLNRFQLVFQNFVASIARHDHPLVLFLDDLQWADPATLRLFHPLLTSSEIRNFLVVGTYRNNEVGEDHPLIRTIRLLESADVNLENILLEPLKIDAWKSFVGDTLDDKESEVEPLARLINDKTGGNPFFVIQFLKTLKRDNFLTFDYKNKRWTYRIEDIKKAAITDNVIDLMTSRIQKLSPSAQNVLMVASCVGSLFDIETVAAVSEQSSEVVSANLEEALNEGLIVPIESEKGDDNRIADPKSQPTYFSFLHDRVQQAAYSLLSSDRKRLLHLLVGRLICSAMERERSDEKVFDAANNLNLGSNLIDDRNELLKLARLNLNAGLKARASSAFDAALDYFTSGANLFDDKYLDADHELEFALRLGAAECNYLCGNFGEAELKFENLLQTVKTKLDKAKVFNLRMVQYENMTRYADSIAVARASLALFDVSFPDTSEEKQAVLENEIESIRFLLGERSIESLIDLPEMTDPGTRMVMNILTDIWSSVYITGDAILARLISATMVRLSLTQGNTAESAYGYVTHAITVGPVLEDYESAYEFGRLALVVNERFNDSRRRAKVYQQFHAHVALWRKPFDLCIEHAREASRSGLEAGDFLYAAYGAYTETWTAYLVTNDLNQFVRDYSPSLTLIRSLKVTAFADAHNLMLHWARALQGETVSQNSLSSVDFDEENYVKTYRDNPFFTMFHAAAKMQICFLLEKGDAALAAAADARKIVHHLSGTIWTAIFDFWNGLILTNYGTGDLSEIEDGQRRISLLAENCPENYLCWSLLLSAEIERAKGNETDAIKFYEQAVSFADKTKSVQHQALSNELYARFWISRGQARIGGAFLTEAHLLYLQWGATAKVNDLEQRYPEFPGWHPKRILPKKGESVVGSLDTFSVIKAAQAVTGDIELEKLLRNLLHIAIENAGAERGSLILEREGELFVYAEGSVDEIKLMLHEPSPVNDVRNIPLSVVHYARRTMESVVIADARTDERFPNDAYIAQSEPLSVMCVPVTNQGRLKGILYLENNFVSGAFTPERAMVCQVVASQAAISLENAGLYNEMKVEAEQRRRAEETLRSIMEGTAAVTGDNFFDSLVEHLATALHVRYAFVTQCRGNLKSKATTLAFWMDNKLTDNVSYEISETPCLNVLAGETCFYPRDVQKLFPNDKELVDMSAEGYLGVPLLDSANKVIGHLAVLDDKPMTQTPQEMSLLSIFAARAGAELERLHAEEELRLAMVEVERLKNQLHAENIYLQEEIRQEHNFDEIIGNSPALLEVLQKIERVAPTDAAVLVTGETGTGKELIARAIHNLSGRRDRPLVKINCGAISAGLVESELFGHVKGAFTGAVDKRAGRFELANGGTVFLDEVGELPLETQVKLLRVLQEGEFEAVGSSKTVKSDVRIIAATNRNLEEAIAEGKFRSDLFYRLNVFPISVPPLRERREDIPSLAVFFIDRLSKKFGKQLEGVTEDAMNLIVNYNWTGNVRELQNVIERATVLAAPEIKVLQSDLLPDLSVGARSEPAQPAQRSVTSGALQDVERDHILTVLERANWVIEGERGAAKMLDLHPNTLRSRMKKLGIERPQETAARATK